MSSLDFLQNEIRLLLILQSNFLNHLFEHHGIVLLKVLQDLYLISKFFQFFKFFQDLFVLFFALVFDFIQNLVILSLIRLLKSTTSPGPRPRIVTLRS